MLFEIVCPATERLSLRELWCSTSCFEIRILSFFHIRGSRVKNPAAFNAGLYSLSASSNALEIP